MKYTHALLALTLALPSTITPSWAQDTDSAAKPADRPRPSSISRAPDTRPVKTFYLKYATGMDYANEMLVALRNMVDPSVKLYLISNRNSITVRADASEFPLIQQILDQIDLPKTSYRLTYTLTEMDAGKRIGTQHVALIVANGQRVTMKQGTKIPVSTGTYNSGTASSQTQMTYLDVGLNFDATLTGFDGGAELKSKVEQSGIAEEKSSIGPQDPVVRQTVIEGISLLTPGKPLILGSLDVPGSTRHLDIEVMMEVLK